MAKCIAKLATTTYQEIVCDVPEGLAVKYEGDETYILRPGTMGQLNTQEWIHSTLALKLGLITPNPNP
jgi:hypothetical protein